MRSYISSVNSSFQILDHEFFDLILMLEKLSGNDLDEYTIKQAVSLVRKLWSRQLCALYLSSIDVSPSVRDALVGVGHWMLAQADNLTKGDNRGVREMITLNKLTTGHA